jgi:hypothetical protein
MKNTIENNKLIAEFMGELVVPSQGIYLIPNTMNLIHNDELTHLQFVVNDLKYHKSWDWLMPVVEKINVMDSYRFTVTIMSSDTQIYDNENCEDAVNITCEFNCDETIKSVYKAVVEFIKWYNNK